MSGARVDAITAILSVPGVEEAGEIRNARPGEPLFDEHFRKLESSVRLLCERQPAAAAPLDEMLATFLGRPVQVNGAELTWYEKKGEVYPALVLPVAGIADAQGGDMAARVTERFRDPDARSALAELIGTRLGLDWVSVYVTFGPGG